jgi:hypothetical protein
MAGDPEDERVGFGRPPKRTRFKKGTSGNPRGRPKKALDFKADLAAVLRETVVLIENGKERRVSSQRAFVMTLVAAAIKKDTRAVSALLACMRHFNVGSEEPPPENVDSGDLDILQNYLERERQRQASSQPPPTGAKKDDSP